ncbi:Spondin-1, partial [Xenoophorus captivus]
DCDLGATLKGMCLTLFFCLWFLCRASIVQKKIIFFQDEGALTKRMCEKESLYGDGTDRPLLDCCACGTAKYRVTFFGNWSEKIHPKDFPRRTNHWSAIIGASHSKNYVLWEFSGLASEGVKQVAELGSPVKMEEEIRQKVRFFHSDILV